MKPCTFKGRFLDFILASSSKQKHMAILLHQPNKKTQDLLQQPKCADF